MKVLILANSGLGTYRFRRQLVEAILDRGDSVILSCPHDTYAEKFEALGVRVERQPVDRRGTDPVADASLLLAYLSLMRRERPDAVLCYTIKPNIYGGLAARFLRIPCMATITGLGTALGKAGPLQRLLIWLYRCALCKARAVWFQNSEDMAFFQRHGILAGAGHLVPGSGVDLDEFGFQPMPEGQGTSFLFAGRILREKGVAEFVRAAALIRARHPDARFHVLGPVEDESLRPLLDTASAEGVIRYHGEADDMRPWYGEAHCTVLPSYYPEGMSNVLLESAASGRAVISTGRAGCGEAFEDGVSGLKVRAADADDLADKMERFLSLPPEEKAAMGLAGRRRMERMFDRRAVTAAYLDVLTREGLQHGL